MHRFGPWQSFDGGDVGRVLRGSGGLLAFMQDCMPLSLTDDSLAILLNQ